jgi:hypothetical protein
MLKNFSMVSFVAGFMLGALCVGAWFMSGDRSASLFPPYTSAGSEESFPESGTISVADQPAGSTVLVETVTVPPPGVWVAVRETVGGELGNVLGAVRVQGPQSAVSISLLRATEPNTPYAVELYRDDGDGVFNLATDSVYVDFATGVPAIARFSTTN